MKADFVLGLQMGDEGKGKITNSLLSGGKYTCVARFSGAHNCGHTIIHNGKKVVTHAIPAGVLWGITSIIGPGCCVNPKKLAIEIKELEDAGIKVKPYLKISKRTHVITSRHLEEDSKDEIIGTTRTGSGPAFREKYGRTGILASQIPELQEYLVDFVDEMDKHEHVLFEGAQGTFLDIIHGEYPFVTSSHCTIGGAIINGIPPKSVNRVYGVIKAYETYVGAKAFHGTDGMFDTIQDIGKEFGATTGRPRQCNFINIDLLKKAIKINGVTDLIVNKMDVIQEIADTGEYWIGVRFNDGTEKIFESEQPFINYITNVAKETGVENIKFSYSPEDI